MAMVASLSTTTTYTRLHVAVRNMAGFPYSSSSSTSHDRVYLVAHRHTCVSTWNVRSRHTPLARHRSIESSIVGRLVRLPASIRLFGIPCSCTSLCSVSPTIYPQPTDQPHNYIFIPNHGPPSRSLLSLPKEQTLH